MKKIVLALLLMVILSTGCSTDYVTDTISVHDATILETKYEGKKYFAYIKTASGEQIKGVLGNGERSKIRDLTYAAKILDKSADIKFDFILSPRTEETWTVEGMALSKTRR